MSDSDVRTTALDPARSFIVQAPAGSGKTELLIRRYLALLPTVDVPEQITAITFTRKAAAEMRNRILNALRVAASGEHPPEPHHRKTFELAERALARDRKQGWNLLEQPQRLRVDTLDALNAWLSRQLPMLSGGVAGAEIIEDAAELYALASRRVLDRLGEETILAGALGRLLRYSGVSVERFESLLAGLLPIRDQWLPIAIGEDDNGLKSHLGAALRRLIDETMHSVVDELPEGAERRLVPALRQAAEGAASDTFSSWAALDSLPPCSATHLSAWRALPELLMTQKDAWRKRFNGFGLTPEVREDLSALIDSADANPALRLALAELRRLPDAELDGEQWQALRALRLLLRHLVAELKLVFAETNTVDFVELALGALAALGESDSPSELLLALDRRLQHILVDEFQDTSESQLRLLELLTSGWEQGDGRTLFLVGDPMQSIYRFRNAEMALFLKTKRFGIGDVSCEPLTLERNFRSSPAVLSWVNDTFPDVFPNSDDLTIGAARFAPCIGTRPGTAAEGFELHALRGRDHDSEVRRVAEILVKERARSADASIAILVQSRSHLNGLRERLRPLDVSVRAVEIDAPNQHQIIQDLLGLTRALLHAGDRIAWLSVLRAPWCGLEWRDLHALCWDDPESAIWTLIGDPERVARLSVDGRQRLERIRETLTVAFTRRRDLTLSRWIEQTWLTLNGPACLDFTDQIHHAEQFFSVLSQITRNGDLDDPFQLERRFDDPRNSPTPPSDSRTEIMTIHRAKGLEFDVVIVLGLGRKSAPNDAKGLHWLQRINADGKEDVLLAPLSSRAGPPDRLTEWLKRAERRKEQSERARLLYVAATRARERLHLVGQLPPEDSPPSGSLLSCIWPNVQSAFDRAEEEAGRSDEEWIVPTLIRLRETATPPVAPKTEVESQPQPEYEWAGQAALHVGTVVHRWLHRVAEEGVERWDSERVESAKERFRRELTLLGVEETDLAWATARCATAVNAVLADRRGQWLLADHKHARSELPLTVVGETGVEHIRLDRTFVDEDNVRWIVDFKTSAHEGGGTEEFLDSEIDRYRAQLERYASAVAATEAHPRPIRVGLYFPLLGAFRQWTPTA